MGGNYLVVLCSCPDTGSAEALSMVILEQKLAACVNEIGGIKSRYHWQDRITTDDEVLLLIKTRGELFERLKTVIKDQHPYELPEIIGVPIGQGSADYLQWIDSATRQ